MLTESFTGIDTPPVTGRILNIIYAKAASASYSNGVDFAVTLEGTSQGLWSEENVNASKTVAPRQATHDTTGTAALYAAAGTAVRDHIAAVNDRVKIAVTNGGASKTGTFTLIVG